MTGVQDNDLWFDRQCGCVCLSFCRPIFCTSLLLTNQTSTNTLWALCSRSWESVAGKHAEEIKWDNAKQTCVSVCLTKLTSISSNSLTAQPVYISTLKIIVSSTVCWSLGVQLRGSVCGAEVWGCSSVIQCITLKGPRFNQAPAYKTNKSRPYFPF